MNEVTVSAEECLNDDDRGVFALFVRDLLHIDIAFQLSHMIKEATFFCSTHQHMKQAKRVSTYHQTGFYGGFCFCPHHCHGQHD
jgi:hypothetical protein